MQKARSRLNRTKSKKRWSGIKLKPSGLAKRYWKHWPTLVIGLFFSSLNWLILTKVDPVLIKHFILPHTYLPFLLSFFLAIFFLVSFLSLQVRTGLLAALAASIILFFQLQKVMFSWRLILALILVISLVELVVKVVQSKISSRN